MYETQGDNDDYEDRGLDSRIFALVPAYTFTCHGNVTEWGAYVEHPGRYRIAFQIWRRDPDDPGCYYLEEENEDSLAETGDGNYTLSLTVQVEDQIAVQPGDIVGFFVRNRDDASFQVDRSLRETVEVFYEEDVTHSFKTPLYICEEDDDYIVYENFEGYEDIYELERHSGAPVITAIVATGEVRMHMLHILPTSV